MGSSDYIVLGIFVLILGLVIAFIVRQKKRGVACIGCPDSGSCQKGKCGGSCGSCHCNND